MSLKSTMTAAAALVVFTVAGAAQAGTPMVVASNPTAAPAGTDVTLSATVFTTCASNAQVAFVDQTNGDAPLCTADLTDSGNASGSCVAQFSGPAGEHTFQGTVINDGGCIYNNTGVHDVIESVPLPVAEVPTMAEWTLWGFAGALLLGGGALVARRSRRFT
jgi:hypothetical protein